MLRQAVLIATLFVQIASSAYSSKLISVDHCKNPVPPYSLGKRLAEEHISLVHKDNRTLVSGNITYYDSCKQCKWSINVMRENKGVKRPIFRIRDMTCKHVIVRAINTIFGIPVDYNTCEMTPGTYNYLDIDIDKLEQNIRLPFRNNGIYYYTSILFVPEGTQVCYNVKTLITFTRNARKPEGRRYFLSSART